MAAARIRNPGRPRNGTDIVPINATTSQRVPTRTMASLGPLPRMRAETMNRCLYNNTAAGAAEEIAPAWDRVNPTENRVDSVLWRLHGRLGPMAVVTLPLLSGRGGRPHLEI